MEASYTDLAIDAAKLWLLVSTVINVATRLKPLRSWVESAEQTRAGAAVLGVVRSIGIDPVRALEIVVLAINARAAAYGASGLLGGPTSDRGGGGGASEEPGRQGGGQ